MYTIPDELLAIEANAANVAPGGNPAYDDAAFLATFPQFGEITPPPIRQMFIGQAQTVVLQSRWHSQWAYGMALFIAHHLTRYLQLQVPGTATASKVVASAQPKGLVSSKSVGDVAISYDFTATNVTGWQQWQTTQYGQQFASIGKLLGKGGMLV